MSMDFIACFTTRTWGISDFWAKEFEKVNVESKKAEVECAKAKQALVEATKANETLLQFIKDS